MYGSFYGWYLKCQSDIQTLSVIPAVHNAGRKRTCSIQIITDNDAWTVTFSADVFQRTKRNIFIGENQFGKEGIRLAIHTSQLIIKGKLDFGPLCPLKYDIMGPFALVPFMECRHSVWSMRHPVGYFIDFAKRTVLFLLLKQTGRLLSLNIFPDCVVSNFLMSCSHCVDRTARHRIKLKNQQSCLLKCFAGFISKRLKFFLYNMDAVSF